MMDAEAAEAEKQKGGNDHAKLKGKKRAPRPCPGRSRLTIAKITCF